MAKEDVNIKVSANVAEAIQLWKAMEAGPEGMAKALDAMGHKGKAATKGFGEELVSQIGKWASIATAVELVTSAINKQGEAMKKLREERLKATDTVDDAMNRFQVQAGIPKGTEADRFRQQFMVTAAERKTTPSTALMVGTQLIASGAQKSEVVGMTDEILQLMSGTNALEGPTAADPRQFAKAFVQMLTANNLKLTRQNVRTQAIAAQGLYMGTNLELAELTQFAPAAATIRSLAHTTPEQSLAVATQFLQLTDIANSATAFRTGVTRLATAKSNTEIQRGLKMIGLKPGDVDFQGEDFEKVMRTLTKGFEGAPGADRASAARLIFGRAGMPFYTTITQPGAMDEMRRRIGLTGNEKQYEQAVTTAQGGRGAERREAEALSLNALYKEGALDPEVVQKRLQAVMAEKGFSEWERANVMSFYENPLPWGSLPFGIGELGEGYMTTAGRAGIASRRAAELTVGKGGDARGTKAIGKEIYEQATGKMEIRLQTDQGLNIPHTVEATGLQDR